MFDAGITIIHRASGHVLGTILFPVLDHQAVAVSVPLTPNWGLEPQESKGNYANGHAHLTIPSPVVHRQAVAVSVPLIPNWG